MYAVQVMGTTAIEKQYIYTVWHQKGWTVRSPGSALLSHCEPWELVECPCYKCPTIANWSVVLSALNIRAAL